MQLPPGESNTAAIAAVGTSLNDTPNAVAALFAVKVDPDDSPVSYELEGGTDSFGSDITVDFRVTAVNSKGYGPSSNTARGKIPATRVGDKLSAPTDLRAVGVDTDATLTDNVYLNTVHLYWNLPNDLPADVMPEVQIAIRRAGDHYTGWEDAAGVGVNADKFAQFMDETGGSDVSDNAIPRTPMTLVWTQRL